MPTNLQNIPVSRHLFVLNIIQKMSANDCIETSFNAVLDIGNTRWTDEKLKYWEKEKTTTSGSLEAVL